jgi:hypothetical protein
MQMTGRWFTISGNSGTRLLVKLTTDTTSTASKLFIDTPAYGEEK